MLKTKTKTTRQSDRKSEKEQIMSPKSTSNSKAKTLNVSRNEKDVPKNASNFAEDRSMDKRDKNENESSDIDTEERRETPVVKKQNSSSKKNTPTKFSTGSQKRFSTNHASKSPNMQTKKPVVCEQNRKHSKEEQSIESKLNAHIDIGTASLISNQTVESTLPNINSSNVNKSTDTVKQLNESNKRLSNEGIHEPCSSSCEDISDRKITVYPSGLHNKELTCYMNSTFQALAASSTLIKEFHQLNQSVSSELLYLLIDILQGINTGSKDVNKKVEKFVKDINWTKTLEQDAFNVLSFIINAVQKSFTPKQLIPPKFRILHSFIENPEYNKIQEHLALAISLCSDFMVQPGVELVTLLNAFFDPSPIDDGESTSLMHIFGKAPTVLILHIQANEWDSGLGMYIKPKYYIRYEEILEYKFIIQTSKNCSKPEEVTCRYQLVAVMHHMGGVESGHYITYRKKEEQWFVTNDEQVTELQFNFDVVPYIMIYDLVPEYL